MPTEKLTSKRIIQLITVLCIFLSAFLYRTCHYTPSVQHVEATKNTVK